MLIHKKVFIESLTKNNSHFCGVSKKLHTWSELQTMIPSIIEGIIEERSCVAHAQYLEFSGGSRLDFNQKGTYSFYEYDYPEGKILVCRHIDFDEVYDKTYDRSMYYFIKK